MNETLETEVAILGAGPVGATLAAALAARGVPTVILDAAPLPPMALQGFDGRAYAIALASQRLLEEAGVWGRLPTNPCRIEGIKVADGRVDERPSPSTSTSRRARSAPIPSAGWWRRGRCAWRSTPGCPNCRVSPSSRR